LHYRPNPTNNTLETTQQDLAEPLHNEIPDTQAAQSISDKPVCGGHPPALTVATVGPMHLAQSTSLLHATMPTITASTSGTHARPHPSTVSSSTSTEAALAMHINWLRAFLHLMAQAGQLPTSADLTDHNFTPAPVNSGILSWKMPETTNLGHTPNTYTDAHIHADFKG